MSIQESMPSSGGEGVAAKLHANCIYAGGCIEGHYYLVDECGWRCGGHVDAATMTCIASCEYEQ